MKSADGYLELNPSNLGGWLCDTVGKDVSDAKHVENKRCACEVVGWSLFGLGALPLVYSALLITSGAMAVAIPAMVAVVGIVILLQIFTLDYRKGYIASIGKRMLPTFAAFEKYNITIKSSIDDVAKTPEKACEAKNKLSATIDECSAYSESLAAISAAELEKVNAEIASLEDLRELISDLKFSMIHGCVLYTIVALERVARYFMGLNDDGETAAAGKIGQLVDDFCGALEINRAELQLPDNDRELSDLIFWIHIHRQF
ncbi:MAG: hypothetical protein LBB38_02440 [Puniceicoccales bacterium]|nr:hypothetical protein [Puniceicoccales bacterium]